MSGRIVIHESLATNRIILKVRLGLVGYGVDIARTPAELLTMLREQVPDAVILGHSMPEADLAAVLSDIRALQGCEALPVMVHGPAIPSLDVARILHAGADCFLARPFQDQDFHARLRRLIGAEGALRRLAPTSEGLRAMGLAEQPAAFHGPGRIAFVTEKPQSALSLRHQLVGLSNHILLSLQPEEALAGHGDNVDVYVIDEKLGAAGNGLRILAELSGRTGSQRARFAIRRVAGGRGNHDNLPEYGFFDGGADEVLSPQMCPAEIAAHLDRLVARKAHLDQLHKLLKDGLRLATVDSLTGLDNRRSGMAQLWNLLRQTGGDPLSDPTLPCPGIAVILMDIDRFKSVNDRFGHPAGDQVLMEVARRLRLALRPQDVLCRFGGEEFLAVLGKVTETEARMIAQRLCDQVERDAVTIADHQAIRVTISAGMALGGGTPGLTETAERLIEEADQALLHSKAAGRNKLTVVRHAA